jgi:hypothetical protein
MNQSNLIEVDANRAQGVLGASVPDFHPVVAASML